MGTTRGDGTEGTLEKVPLGAFIWAAVWRLGVWPWDALVIYFIYDERERRRLVERR